MDRAGATPFESIFAPASPEGIGERAVLRISGPLAFPAVEAISGEALPRARRVLRRKLLLDGPGVCLPALVLSFVAPRSYTGEDLVERHVPSSPPIRDWLPELLQAEGLRLAWPGEFSRRAYLNGKLDLAQAEAVLAVIRAEDDAALRHAEAILQGDSAAQSARLRDKLLSLLSLLEGGLDFTQGETGEVPVEEWRPELEALARELPDKDPGEASSGRERPGYLLLGPPNAGKTSLWNALGIEGSRPGQSLGLVSASPGTTRDLRWALCAGGYRLGDAPGRASAAPAQELRILARELCLADGYAWVEPASSGPLGPPAELPEPRLRILSKRDLMTEKTEVKRLTAMGWMACSARSGQGLARLDKALAGLGRRGTSAGDWSALLGERRLRVRSALTRACEAAAIGLGPECVAAELREILAVLAPEQGSEVPEEVLDRIFARFCLGK
ncbi:MAG: GTPase [Planctomycetota bacterium]